MGFFVLDRLIGHSYSVQSIGGWVDGSALLYLCVCAHTILRVHKYLMVTDVQFLGVLRWRSMYRVWLLAYLIMRFSHAGHPPFCSDFRVAAETWGRLPKMILSILRHGSDKSLGQVMKV
jgi:hypothetical protein